MTTYSWKLQMSTSSESESRICHSLRPFGTTILAEMTAWSIKTGAVNLSQGYPDFEGPESVRRRTAQPILEGPNQCVHPAGVPSPRRAVAEKMKRFCGLDVDPETEVTSTAGASEGAGNRLPPPKNQSSLYPPDASYHYQ